MRRLGSVIVFLFSFLAVNGQFTGGSGDGFSSAEVSIEVTSLDALSEQVHVYPSAQKAGRSIQITGENFQEVWLISSLGQSYRLDFVSSQYQLPSRILEGVYVLSMTTNRGIIQSKMYVYP